MWETAITSLVMSENLSVSREPFWQRLGTFRFPDAQEHSSSKPPSPQDVRSWADPRQQSWLRSDWTCYPQQKLLISWALHATFYPYVLSAHMPPTQNLVAALIFLVVEHIWTVKEEYQYIWRCVLDSILFVICLRDFVKFNKFIRFRVMLWLMFIVFV